MLCGQVITDGQGDGQDDEPVTDNPTKADNVMEG